MKSENVKLSKELNEAVWKHGIRNPPHHVKVKVTKDDKGVVNADLFPVEKPASKKKVPAEKKPAKKESPKKPEAEQKE